MTELSKKQRVAKRREEKVAELQTIFRRSYEMGRAWGSSQPKVLRIAFKEVETFVNASVRKVPQEKSFILSCFSEFKSGLKALVAQEEGQDAS